MANGIQRGTPPTASLSELDKERRYAKHYAANKDKAAMMPKQKKPATSRPMRPSARPTRPVRPSRPSRPAMGVKKNPAFQKKPTGKPAVRAKPAMKATGKPARRMMPDEDRYPRSRAAYGMARGGTVKFKRGETVLEGYEYEGEGIVAKSNTPSKKHIKRNPVFQKKVAKKGSSTPSSKSRKINPIFKTKKAARGGKIK